MFYHQFTTDVDFDKLVKKVSVKIIHSNINVFSLYLTDILGQILGLYKSCFLIWLLIVCALADKP